MLHKVQRPQWQPFIDRVCSALGEKRVDAHIVGPGLGNPSQARRMTLVGISYDRNGDVFALIGEDLEHSIAHPRAMNVDEDPDALRSLQVVDSVGNHHILTLIAPLRLPPPG